MEQFFNTIAQLTALSIESRNALASILERAELPKGEILIKAGMICEHVYFLEKGLARTYYYKDGKDVTDWLGAEGSFMVSIVSFLTRKPDRRIVELLEPSVVWSLSYRKLEELYSKHHEIERLGRLLANYGIILLQQRFDALHFATAAERYTEFAKNNPTLLQRVPLGMIASYLGMSQETLSRIRAQG